MLGGPARNGQADKCYACKSANNNSDCSSLGQRLFRERCLVRAPTRPPACFLAEWRWSGMGACRTSIHFHKVSTGKRWPRLQSVLPKWPRPLYRSDSWAWI